MDKKQVILAVDTATEYCSVALQVKDKVYIREKLAPQQHASLILGMVDEVLGEAKIGREDLELIGFGQGPGSFTGVRIACSVAQGIALGLDKPVIGVNEIKLLALGALEQEGIEAKQGQWVLGSIDARMGEVYYGLYQLVDGKLETVLDVKVASPEQAIAAIQEVLSAKNVAASDVICAGTGIAILREQGWAGRLVEGDQNLYPKARLILKVYASEECALLDAAAAEPLYCRNEVTWKKIGEQ